MSLEGTVTALQKLRGKINGLDVIYYDTYQIAVKQGFNGTIDEWLDSLGDKYIVQFESLTDEQKAELKGADGYTPVKGVDYFDGEDGEDGKTPVKGTDYWTEAEKEEISSEAASMVTAKDITSRVKFSSASGEYAATKATDNGNTIVISARCDTDFMLTVENHDGYCVGGLLLYYDESNNDNVFKPIMGGGSLDSGVTNQGGGVFSVTVVLYYV